MEPSIVSFLVELLAGRTFMVDTLRSIIRETRKRKDIDIASGNATTLLNCMGHSFAYQDWSNVRMIKADLCDSVFNGANLDGANLNGCKMLQSQLVLDARD